MFEKILVAIDFSSESSDVFETAVFIAKTTRASLMLLHVLPIEDLMGKAVRKVYEKEWQRFLQQRLEFLRSLVREATTVGVNAEFTIFWGIPGRDICAVSQTWSADSIVVGSRGRTGIKEVFLGSVSNYVTHHAPCSVLIVRKTVNPDSQLSQSDREKLTPSTSQKLTDAKVYLHALNAKYPSARQFPVDRFEGDLSDRGIETFDIGRHTLESTLLK